jgi:protein involved in polysaccharide export with SLBB domain/beta-lactamase regulating signal transducer with metallopeptidase domain
MMAFDDPIVYRIGWTLVHSVWQGAAIAGGLAIVLGMGKRLSSNSRYILSCGAMLLVLAAAAVTFQRSQLSTVEAARVPVQPVRPIPLLVDDSSAKPQAAVSATSGQSLLNMDRAVPLLVVVWGMGVILISAWQFGGWVLLRRFRTRSLAVDAAWQGRLDALRQRMGIGRVALALTDRLDIPIVIGTLRPMILAPVAMLNEMSIPQVEAILAHELAHVKRYDYLLNLIQVVIETLLFYHPAVWWIGRQIRREREHCCDEIAAEACGDRAGYARALTALEESRARGSRLAPAAAGGGGRGELLGRVRRLLDPAPNSSVGGPRSWATLILLLVVAGGMPMASRFLRAADIAPTTVKVGEPKDSPITPEDFAPDTTPYKLGPTDLITVKISDLVAPNVVSEKTARLDKDGILSLPLIGKLKLSEQTVADAEKLISAAYSDKQLLKDANVKVQIMEARGQTFSIVGAVTGPGEYVVVDANTRLIDALKLAKGAPKGANVRVVRGDRMIRIPADRIAAADPKFNIIIRPKDVVLVEQPAQLKAISILVAQDGLRVDGQPATWASIRKTVQAMPVTEREQTYLALSAGSSELPVRVYFEALGQAENLVKELGLSHVSQTGIDPKAQAAEVGEYYVGGNVPRTGVYSLTARKITIKQALVAAGGPDRSAPYVSLLRRNGNREEYVLWDTLIQDLFDGKQADIYLKPNDQIMVTSEKHATTQPAELPEPGL